MGRGRRFCLIGGERGSNPRLRHQKRSILLGDLQLMTRYTLVVVFWTLAVFSHGRESHG